MRTGGSAVGDLGVVGEVALGVLGGVPFTGVDGAPGLAAVDAEGHWGVEVGEVEECGLSAQAIPIDPDAGELVKRGDGDDGAGIARADAAAGVGGEEVGEGDVDSGISKFGAECGNDDVAVAVSITGSVYRGRPVQQVDGPASDGASSTAEGAAGRERAGGRPERGDRDDGIWIGLCDPYAIASDVFPRVVVGKVSCGPCVFCSDNSICHRLVVKIITCSPIRRS